MSARRRAQAGVTLIELLIAVTLVSLLSVAMLYALRVGVNSMERSSARFYSNRRVLGAQRILEQQLAGIMLVWADCRGGEGAPPNRVPFFQGDPDAMRFVSSYSLADATRGPARALEFHVIPAENNEGVRLIVNEILYTGSMGLGSLCYGLGPDPVSGQAAPRFAPISVGPQSFVLADQLAFCRIFYKEPLPQAPFERWVPKWVKPELPRAIRLEMAPLHPDPGRLPLLTVAMPVRVNRNPTFTYVD